MNLDSLESVIGEDGEGEGLEAEQVDQEHEVDDESDEADTDTEDTAGEKDTQAPPAGEAQKADKPAPKGDDDEQGMVPKRAVLDERRKRQALEQELAQLRAQVNPDAHQPPARPDVFEDQEGAFGHLEHAFETRLVTQRIEISQELMREKHEDYDEAEAEFVELAKADPSLVQKMKASTLPAKFVYDHVQKHRQLQEMQDVEGYKAKLREQVRAEILAELEAERGNGGEAGAEAPARATLPPQLANRRSADKAPMAHESLEDILGQ